MLVLLGASQDIPWHTRRLSMTIIYHARDSTDAGSLRATGLPWPTWRKARCWCPWTLCKVQYEGLSADNKDAEDAVFEHDDAAGSPRATELPWPTWRRARCWCPGISWRRSSALVTNLSRLLLLMPLTALMQAVEQRQGCHGIHGGWRGAGAPGCHTSRSKLQYTLMMPTMRPSAKVFMI